VKKSSFSDLNLDPFDTKTAAEKYPVAQHPDPAKKKHSQKRRFRSHFIVNSFYRAKLDWIKVDRNYASIEDVVNAALSLVITRYLVGQETDGPCKSVGRFRPEDREDRYADEQGTYYRIDPEVRSRVDCIFVSNRLRGVKRMFLLEEGIDMLLGIDRSVRESE